MLSGTVLRRCQPSAVGGGHAWCVSLLTQASLVKTVKGRSAICKGRAQLGRDRRFMEGYGRVVVGEGAQQPDASLLRPPVLCVSRWILRGLCRAVSLEWLGRERWDREPAGWVRLTATAGCARGEDFGWKLPMLVPVVPEQPVLSCSRRRLVLCRACSLVIPVLLIHPPALEELVWGRCPRQLCVFFVLPLPVPLDVETLLHGSLQTGAPSGHLNTC